MPSWIGVLIKLGALALVTIAEVSKQWRYGGDDDVPGPPHGWILLTFIVLGMLACFLSLFRRTAGVTALAISSAFAAIGASTIAAFSADGIVGPAFSLMLAGFVLAIVGIAVTPVVARNPQEREVGDTVDGSRHGRWHVYDARGQCIEIRVYDHGKLIEQRPYLPQ